jgi:threonine/homoserine/homoserine lactone efflux protein
MNFDLLSVYILVASVVIVTPGPNVLLIISQSINLGKREGIRTIIGTSLAMAIQLFVAGLGITSILLFVSEWFSIIKWLGVAYLVYLGLKQLFQKERSNKNTKLSKQHSLLKGFVVSATNPKQIIFFAAFIPQFIDTSYPVTFQVVILSAIYFVIAIFSDLAYAYFAAKLSKSLPSHTAVLNKVSGGLLLGAALLLGSLELSTPKTNKT